MVAEGVDTLYSFRRCPYAMRARMALLVSGTRFAIREVALRAKPQAMIELSPKATVPVLALADGGVIDQSLDIMTWALARHDPERWLAGHDADLIAGSTRGSSITSTATNTPIATAPIRWSTATPRCCCCAISTAG